MSEATEGMDFWHDQAEDEMHCPRCFDWYEYGNPDGHVCSDSAGRAYPRCPDCGEQVWDLDTHVCVPPLPTSKWRPKPKRKDANPPTPPKRTLEPLGDLTVYRDVEQGTEEWHQLRLGKLTASTIGALLTGTLKVADNETSRGLLRTILAEQITGEADETYISHDMERGTLDEPIARDYYAEHYAPVEEVGFMTRDIGGTILGYSPDGLVGEDGLIEIKSRRPKAHLKTILENEVPPENMAQLQAGLLVSGRAWVDYVSFSGGLPLFVKRIEPDPAWQEAIHAATTTAKKQLHQWSITYEENTKDAPETEKPTHFEEMF